MRKLLLFVLGSLALLALCATVGRAWAGERYPVTDWRHRTAVGASGGYVSFTSGPGRLEEWRGLDAAGALTYSAHDRLALYGIYSHGWPLGPADGDLATVRAGANLSLYPAPGSSSPLGLVAGAGGMWLGRASPDEWRGYDAHVVVTAALGPHLGAFLTYVHGITAHAEPGDLAYVRAGLQAGFVPFGGR